MIEMQNREYLRSIDCSVEDQQVFNVALYSRLFNQVVGASYTREEARAVVAAAAQNDGVGVVTENLSGAKNESGQYIFDTESKIRMQLTPSKHFYLQEEDADGQQIMVAPEHTRGNFKIDFLETISPWRRGLDRVGMAGVRRVFLDQAEDGLKEGEMIIWGSPRAEAWEGEKIMRYNGAYGFLYVGRVVDINGKRALEVHDFKNNLDAGAYLSLLDQLGELQTSPQYLDHPLVDKVKSSFAISRKAWTDEEIWRSLGSRIFGLPLQAVLALQDRQLHERIRIEVAAPVAGWIADAIYRGIPDSVIQEQVKQKFIEKTRDLITQLKAERIQDRYLPEFEARPLLQNSAPFDYRNTNTINWIDLAILEPYEGSSGDGCGSWGGSTKVSSVGVMSSLFTAAAISASTETGDYHLGSCKICNRSSVWVGGCDICTSCEKNM